MINMLLLNIFWTFISKQRSNRMTLPFSIDELWTAILALKECFSPYTANPSLIVHIFKGNGNELDACHIDYCFIFEEHSAHLHIDFAGTILFSPNIETIRGEILRQWKETIQTCIRKGEIQTKVE